MSLPLAELSVTVKAILATPLSPSSMLGEDIDITVGLSLSVMVPVPCTEVLPLPKFALVALLRFITMVSSSSSMISPMIEISRFAVVSPAGMVSVSLASAV